MMPRYYICEAFIRSMYRIPVWLKLRVLITVVDNPALNRRQVGEVWGISGAAVSKIIKEYGGQ